MLYQVSGSPLVTLQPAQIRVNDLGDGTATLIITKLGDPNTLKRDDGSPAQVGDVMSCQPDGTWQTRPPGAQGGYERGIVQDGCSTHNPQGPTHPGYVFALRSVPND